MRGIFLFLLVFGCYLGSAQDVGEAKGQFSVFAGVGVAPTISAVNVEGARSQFDPALSPSFDLGLRYMHDLGGGLHGSLALGVEFNVLRNKFRVIDSGFSPVYESMTFNPATLFAKFLEAGMLYNSSMFDDQVSIFMGYRLVQLSQMGYGYGESNFGPGSDFSSNVDVNPHNKILHAVVFRPEFIFCSPQSGERRVGIAVEGMLVAAPGGKEYIDGQFQYNDAEGNTSTGILQGTLGHFSVVVQYYL